jgi:hypothetical protein
MTKATKAVDSSVVIAAFASWHEHHVIARKALAARPRLIAYAAIESYSVLTRLPPPHRAQPPIVHAFISERFAEPFLTLPETGYQELLATLATEQILGGPAYDALIASSLGSTRPHWSPSTGEPAQPTKPSAPRSSSLLPDRELPGQSACRLPGRRPRLISLLRRLSASRRSRAARFGRVGTRGRCGGATASRSSAASRARAAFLFASWLRCSDAVTVSTPPASRRARRPSARSRAHAGSAAECARSKESSTRLPAVLTDWPPGPGDRENRSRSSPPGITSHPLTGRSSAILQACPVRLRCCPQAARPQVIPPASATALRSC